MELKVNSLKYKYKNKQVLKVTFGLNSSNIYGLYGPYKTLLLEILDLQKKYQGKILIDGVLIDNKNKLDFQRQISLIKQDNKFYTSSPIEEMKFIMNNFNYNPKDLKKRMDDALNLVGLSSNYLTRKFASLSNSEKTLVKVACGLVTNPKVILFDETFTGLDYNSKKILLSLVRKLKERKDKLIVIASFDIDLLYQFTDRMLLLENGSIICNEESNKFFKNITFL